MGEAVVVVVVMMMMMMMMVVVVVVVILVLLAHRPLMRPPHPPPNRFACLALMAASNTCDPLYYNRLCVIQLNPYVITGFLYQNDASVHVLPSHHHW